MAVISGCVYLLVSVGMALAGLADNHYFDRSASTGSIAYDSYWISTRSPLCAIQVVALFVCLQNLESLLAGLSQKSLALIKLLSSATLGVYLFHIFMVNWLQYNTYMAALLQCMTAKAIVIYMVTGAVVLLGKHIIKVFKNKLTVLVRK